MAIAIDGVRLFEVVEWTILLVGWSDWEEVVGFNYSSDKSSLGSSYRKLEEALCVFS